MDDLKVVRDYFLEGVRMMDALIEEDLPGKPVIISVRYAEGGKVRVEWEPFSTDESVNIYFYAEEIHKEWEHDVNKYLKDHKTPIVPESGFYEMGGERDDTHELTWRAVMTIGVTETNSAMVSPEKPPPAPVLKKPSGNPADWEGVERDFLIPKERTWGEKQSTVAPIAAFQVEGKIRLIYSGTWGGAVRPCIADFDGESWTDYPNNPVHDKFMPWQHGWRISPGGVFRDGDTYVCYFNEAGSAGETKYYGMRCVGIMTSKNLINWELSEEPILTHDMLHDEFSDILKEPTPSIHGRVYCRNAFLHKGVTYLTLDVSVDYTGKPSHKKVGVKSKDGRTGWERFDFGGGIIPEDPVIEFDGKYYSSIPRYGDGKRGATIITADRPTGPYRYLYDGPLFDTEMRKGNHRETCLFHHNGKWHIVTGIRDSKIVEEKYGTGVRIMKMGRER